MSSPRSACTMKFETTRPSFGMHARAVGVEDADDPDIDLVLAVVVEEQRLRAALALVVAGAAADGIDVAPVALRLRMHLRVAVNLARARLKDARLHPLREAEAVDRPHDRRLRRLDGIELVVRRRGGTGEVVDLVHLILERVDDVVPHKFEGGWPAGARCWFPPGEKIVEADDLVPVLEQAIAEMGTQKAGAAGDKNTHGGRVREIPPCTQASKSQASRAAAPAS
jgi:hypothetical protein